MIISTISITAFQASAVSQAGTIEEIVYTYEYEGMSSEKAAQIVKTMFGIQDGGAQLDSVLCWFGHNIENGTVTTITHRVHSSNPRCVETVSSIELCTRNNCSYFNVLRESTMRIFCCS